MSENKEKKIKTINDLNKFDSPTEENIVLKCLKDKYFSLLKAENYPHTENTTKELDSLENAIRGLVNKK